jgi:hypothetical protein
MLAELNPFLAYSTLFKVILGTKKLDLLTP